MMKDVDNIFAILHTHKTYEGVGQGELDLRNPYHQGDLLS
jgi:hypothetical protein